MITEYTIPIVRTRIKKKQMTSMHIIAGFMFVLLGAITWAVPNTFKGDKVNLLQQSSGIFTLAGIAIVIVTIILNKQLSKKILNSTLRVIELILFIIVAIYCTQVVWYMPLIYACIGILTVGVTFYLELNAHKPEYIKINKEGIHLKRGNVKQIKWKEVKNFLVRHGNVTINLRNNKLYQFTVHSFKQVEAKIDMEQLAKQYIDANEKDYEADWD